MLMVRRASRSYSVGPVWALKPLAVLLMCLSCGATAMGEDLATPATQATLIPPPQESPQEATNTGEGEEVVGDDSDGTSPIVLFARGAWGSLGSLFREGLADWAKSAVGMILTLAFLLLLGRFAFWPKLRHRIDAIMAGQQQLKEGQKSIEHQNRTLADQLLTLRLQLDGKGAFQLRRLDVRYHRILLLGEGSSGKTTLIENLFRSPTRDGLAAGGRDAQRRRAATQHLQLWRLAHEVSTKDRGFLYRYDVYDYRGQDASQLDAVLNRSGDGVLDAKPFTAVVLMVDLFATDNFGKPVKTVRPENKEPLDSDADPRGRWDRARLDEHLNWSRVALQLLFGRTDIKPQEAVIFVNKIDLLHTASEAARELTEEEIEEAFGRLRAQFGKFFEGRARQVSTLQGSAKRGWALRELEDILQASAQKLDA